ncbi:CIC11C00000004481 [Sungouiella intermedia]|uniref:Sorting nexin MVP1 n=1 Tax=Sungouiella intermedia TaxID=45354 RepID=A0A1L0GGH3_9ASCO|nr:CIC11C00000004481 [[Candida] intermedia]
MNSGLPPLPPASVELLLLDSPSVPEPVDQLTSQLANTSISDDHDDREEDWGADGLLADHSALLIDPDTTSPESLHVNDYPYLSKYVGDIRDQFKPLVGLNNAIKIKEVPEKEGLLFKHINYAISHDLHLGMHGPSGIKKVIRRYSDFVWLLEFLLKIGASPDSQFLQRRRRGLHRFLNQLVKHPVLRQEPIVVTFLSVPTDLSSWRKQARVDYSLEFKGQKILTNFINSIWPSVGEEFLQNWKAAEANIPKLIDTWTKLVMLVERYEKRQQQIACDNSKFVEMLSKFSANDDSLYPHKDTEHKVISAMNKDDTSSINDSLSFLSAFFNKTSTLLIDESYIINTTILKKFKNYLDYLYSLQELFDRSKKLSINSIPQLQQKIQENERKYESLSKDDVDIKGSELVKLRQAIINDKQEMFQQLNKDWLIKSCCFDEYIMFQETQFLISEAWTDWCKGRFKFQEKFAGLYDNLNNDVVPDMPLGR